MSNVDPSESCERRALAEFLKAMRARLKPADLGLPAAPRRRAAGLLREEVAQAAGMSVTWYTWMEQGRRVNPSAQVLNGIARALRLDGAERAYLFRLARPDLRAADAGPEVATLDPPLDALLMGLAPHPAYAIDTFLDVVAWNRAAECLLGSFEGEGRLHRNVMGRLFVDPAWQELLEDWETVARSAVGQFRSMTAAHQGDARLVALVEELAQASPLFERLWRQQQVETPPAWRKTLNHAAAGRLIFDYATFRPDGAGPHLRFTIYTAADVATADAFRACLDAA